MRVQAKRVQSDDKLKIKHEVKSSGEQQHDLLLDGATADNVKPLYCIYCTEPQRSLWTQSHPRSYQTGCLLADANDVSVTTKKLGEIECKCIPWHYLFEQAKFTRFARWEHELIGVVPGRAVSFLRDIVSLSVDDSGGADRGRRREEGWNAPTIADLNRGWDDNFDPTGVAETSEDSEEDLKRFRSALGGEHTLQIKGRFGTAGYIECWWSTFGRSANMCMRREAMRTAAITQGWRKPVRTAKASNSPHARQSLAQYPHLLLVLDINRKQTPVAPVPGHRRAQSSNQLGGRSR